MIARRLALVTALLAACGESDEPPLEPTPDGPVGPAIDAGHDARRADAPGADGGNPAATCAAPTPLGGELELAVNPSVERPAGLIPTGAADPPACALHTLTEAFAVADVQLAGCSPDDGCRAIVTIKAVDAAGAPTGVAPTLGAETFPLAAQRTGGWSLDLIADEPGATIVTRGAPGTALALRDFDQVLRTTIENGGWSGGTAISCSGEVFLNEVVLDGRSDGGARMERGFVADGCAGSVINLTVRGFSSASDARPYSLDVVAPPPPAVGLRFDAVTVEDGFVGLHVAPGAEAAGVITIAAARSDGARIEGSFGGSLTIDHPAGDGVVLTGRGASSLSGRIASAAGVGLRIAARLSTGFELLVEDSGSDGAVVTAGGDATLSGAVLRRSAGAGLRLAAGGVARDGRLEDSGGAGIVVDGDASTRLAGHCFVTGSAGNGVELRTGTIATSELFSIQNRGHGVLVDGPAARIVTEDEPVIDNETTFSDNGGDGLRVARAAQVDLPDIDIQRNSLGVNILDDVAVVLGSGIVAQNRSTGVVLAGGNTLTLGGHGIMLVRENDGGGLLLERGRAELVDGVHFHFNAGGDRDGEPWLS